MQKFHSSSIKKDVNNPLPAGETPATGVEVRVKLINNDLATIYSANDPIPSNAIAQPLTTDANGHIEFYAPNGRYNIVYSTLSGDRIISDVIIYDPDDGGSGDMLKSTYDPTDINASAFDRSNHTGTQAISTVSGLQASLDDKVNTSFTPIAIATTLVAGGKYKSTATATHTLPAASGGKPINITWQSGTTMTLTSSSNIVITKDAEYIDTTWNFTNFIQELTLVDTGARWEVK
tara:strand:+ start:57 stop:758 length:702 start_codon:yes stop_codon:yes gene_type:complete